MDLKIEVYIYSGSSSSIVVEILVVLDRSNISSSGRSDGSSGGCSLCGWPVLTPLSCS